MWFYPLLNSNPCPFLTRDQGYLKINLVQTREIIRDEYKTTIVIFTAVISKYKCHILPQSISLIDVFIKIKIHQMGKIMIALRVLVFLHLEVACIIAILCTWDMPHWYFYHCCHKDPCHNRYMIMWPKIIFYFLYINHYDFQNKKGKHMFSSLMAVFC